MARALSIASGRGGPALSTAPRSDVCTAPRRDVRIIHVEHHEWPQYRCGKGRKDDEESRRQRHRVGQYALGADAFRDNLAHAVRGNLHTDADAQQAEDLAGRHHVALEVNGPDEASSDDVAGVLHEALAVLGEHM